MSGIQSSLRLWLSNQHIHCWTDTWTSLPRWCYTISFASSSLSTSWGWTSQFLDRSAHWSLTRKSLPSCTLQCKWKTHKCLVRFCLGIRSRSSNSCRQSDHQSACWILLVWSSSQCSQVDSRWNQSSCSRLSFQLRSRLSESCPPQQIESLQRSQAVDFDRLRSWRKSAEELQVISCLIYNW